MTGLQHRLEQREVGVREALTGTDSRGSAWCSCGQWDAGPMLDNRAGTAAISLGFAEHVARAVARKVRYRPTGAVPLDYEVVLGGEVIGTVRNHRRYKRGRLIDQWWEARTVDHVNRFQSDANGSRWSAIAGLLRHLREEATP